MARCADRESGMPCRAAENRPKSGEDLPARHRQARQAEGVRRDGLRSERTDEQERPGNCASHNKTRRLERSVMDGYPDDVVSKPAGRCLKDTPHDRSTPSAPTVRVGACGRCRKPCGHCESEARSAAANSQRGLRPDRNLLRGKRPQKHPFRLSAGAKRPSKAIQRASRKRENGRRCLLPHHRVYEMVERSISAETGDDAVLAGAMISHRLVEVVETLRHTNLCRRQVTFPEPIIGQILTRTPRGGVHNQSDLRRNMLHVQLSCGC